MYLENEIREFENAWITLKGNAMRCGNSIFSIRNIVSVTFDSVRKDNPTPRSIRYFYKKSWSFFKFLILTIILAIAGFFLVDNYPETVNQLIGELSLKIKIPVDDINTFIAALPLLAPVFLAFSILCAIIATLIKWTYRKFHYIHGLRVIFTNGMTLYFIAKRRDKTFIDNTINALNSFIENPEQTGNGKKINFVNMTIERIDNSNVVGGNVNGNVVNRRSAIETDPFELNAGVQQ